MTLWNRDCTDYPDLNLYGSHPFLMEVRPGEDPILYNGSMQTVQRLSSYHALYRPCISFA